MSVEEHRHTAAAGIGCQVITVSDTRNEATDKSGRLIKELLIEHGHIIELYAVVKDEKKEILEAAAEGLRNPKVDAVLLNGGTGIARRDVTIEAVQEIFEKEIPGFGEIFRLLSYQEDIGSAAILSRAAAGTAENKAIFAMPGSSGAVRLAMQKLILPELGHVVKELKKDL